MSVILNAPGEGLTRTTQLASAASDYTVLFWVKVLSTPSGGLYTIPFGYINGPYTQWATISSRPNNNNYFLSVSNGAFTGTSETTLTVGTWYPMAYVRTGNDHSFYVNGVLIGMVALNISGNAFTSLLCGDDGFSHEDIEVAYFREYQRALTLAELTAELGSTIPVSTTNLLTDTPLQSDLLDDSGNARNWAGAGAFTFSSNTPLTNITSSTAIDIGSVLPYDIVQNVVDGSGTAQTVYYKFTPNFTGVIGLWGSGSSLTVYRPETSVYSPDAITIYAGLDGSLGNIQNKRIQFPVTSGQTYWFEFVPNGNPSPAILTLNIQRAPENPAQLGDLFIPSDNASGDSFPATVLVPNVDNTVRRFVWPFPHTEQGDTSSTGRFLIDKRNTNFVSLYEVDFTLVSDIPFNSPTQEALIRTCRGTNRFFVADPQAANMRVSKIDTSGTILQTWNITTALPVRAIAAQNDESILYYAEPSAAGITIKRYDLNASAPLSNLVAPLFGYGITDMLVLEDNTIVALYAKGGPAEIFARRFDTTGAILNTYGPLADYQGEENRLAYAAQTGHFWIWYQVNNPVDGLARFLKVKFSDGTFTQNFTKVRYDLGIYEPPETLTPIYEFGPVISCPFFELMAAASTGTIIVNKVTIPTDATLFDIVASGGAITPTNYQLANGGSQVHSGLVPGTYSITEVANALYDTVITVDNGDPNTAIDLGAGETITVTITNTLKSAVSATLLVLKMTDPLNTAQLFEFTAGGSGISPTSFALHSEETILFHVAPGTYSIVEDAYSNFKTTYMIDNDPTGNNLAIVIGAGENISVGVLNEAFGGGLFFPNPTVPGSFPPNTFPPGTGQPHDKVPDQNAGSVQVAIPWFAITGFVRDL